jgi:hypothetical protein
MKKKLLLVFTHILAAVLGGAVAIYIWFGFNVYQKITEANATMTQAALISRYALFTDVMRSNGTKEEYKESLLKYLAALDEAAKQPSSVLFDKKTYARDKTLTYARLSRLEKEAGNITKSVEYIKLATENCGNSGWKDCSVDQIAMISKKLEENTGFKKKKRE